LTRGEKDRGVIAQPDLVPPFPTIERILTPTQPRAEKPTEVPQQPVAELGDTITIVGHHFNTGRITVMFTSPALTKPIQVSPEPDGTYDRIRVAIRPSPQTPWVAGMYTVGLEVLEKEGTPQQTKRTTNEVGLSLAPTITTALPLPIQSANGDATVNLTCSLTVRPEQRAALLLGHREIPAEPHPGPTNALTFVVKQVEPDTYFIRLRVDGTDSILIDRTGPRPTFKPHQVVIS
jgi:hypothetical protein